MYRDPDRRKASVREAARRYYERHKREVIARTREREARHPEKHAEQSRKYSTRYNQLNRDKRRDYLLRRAYGITLAQYRELHAAQGGCCAVCGVSVDGNLHVDHNHKTGVVRGLLCGPCNLILGHIEARGGAWLQRLLDYLQRHT